MLKTNSGKAEVFYIETFDIYTEENTPTVSGLYINHDGETRFWDGSVWENTSYALTDEITGPNESQVPSVKAVCDYVSSAINNIPAPEIPEATTYQPGDGIDITDNTISVNIAEDSYLEIDGNNNIATTQQLKTDIDNKLSWQKVDSYSE